jgi:NTP pyrophosphatase (non-canonical NTP hydrolase)
MSTHDPAPHGSPPGANESSGSSGNAAISLRAFQDLIREMYLPKDVARGVDGTFMWLMEEVGELAAALRSGTPEEKAAEFADVLAWLATIANVAQVDLEAAVRDKYGAGCPGCGAMRCQCDDQGKP